MARQDEIIIEVEVNAGETAQKLADVKNRMAELKAEQKSLNEAIKASGTVTAEQAQQMANVQNELKDLTKEEKMYTSQLKTATDGDKQFGASLNSLSQQLAKMKAEYRDMSKEVREGAKGQELLGNIKALDKQLKDADAEMGDFFRNVGNYQSALSGLSGNAKKVADLFAGHFSNGIAAGVTSLKNLGATMLATPFGWILLAVRGLTVAFNGLSDAMKRSDDVSTEMAKNMAQIESVKTQWRRGWDRITTSTVNAISTIITKLNDLDDRMASSWFGKKSREAANKRIKQSKELREEWKTQIEAEDRLEEAERKYQLAHANREAQIAELRDKSYNEDVYTLKQRKDFYAQMRKLEEDDIQQKRSLANEEVSLVIKRNKLMNDTSDEAKQRETDARVKLKNIQTEYFNFVAGIDKKMTKLNKSAESSAASRSAAVQKAAEDEAKAVEEAAKKELAELRKLEDLRARMIDDDFDRRREQTRLNYARQIEDIGKRFETEKNLTAEAKKAIGAQITLLQQQLWKELSKIDDEELKKASDKIKQMDEEAQKRYDAAVKKTRDEYALESQRIANDMQARLNAVYGNAAATAQFELEQAQQYYDSLTAMNADTYLKLFETEENYKNAVLQAEAQVLQARQNSAQALQSQADEVGKTMQAVTGALSDMYEAAAGDSEQYENFKKAMAIVDATISLATTIASATAASTAGDPYTMAIRIATNVAAVTAQFAAVIKAIKAAQIPSAGNYSEGGVVPGHNYYGDRMTAGVNSKELILNERQTANLFEAIKDGSAAILRLGMQEAVVSGAKSQRLADLIRAGVPTNGIDYRLLAIAMREAIAELPAPVLDYRQFTTFQRRVELENNKVINA